MSRFLRFSMNAYRALSILYPEDLRRDFGVEMAEAFEESLADGAVRAWWLTLREAISIGLAGQRSNPLILVPVFSALLNMAFLILELLPTLKRASQPGAEAAGAVLLTGALTAVVAFAAVRRRKSEILVSLGLSQ